MKPNTHGINVHGINVHYQCKGIKINQAYMKTINHRNESTILKWGVSLFFMLGLELCFGIFNAWV